MIDNRCNGWTNYETWKVKLELIGDSHDYEVHTQSVDGLAEEMRLYCEDIILCETKQGFAFDCAMAFLRQVNWREIAENIMGEDNL